MLDIIENGTWCKSCKTNEVCGVRRPAPGRSPLDGEQVPLVADEVVEGALEVAGTRPAGRHPGA